MGDIEDIFDWFYGIISGSIPLADDYVPQVGDTIATTTGILNTGYLSIDDDEILGTMDAISDMEFVNDVYRETGFRINIIDRRGKTISSGNEWEYKYTYDIEESTGSPSIYVVAAVIISVSAAIIAVLWAIDEYLVENTKIVTPWGEVNLFPILAIGVVAIVFLMLLREVLGLLGGGGD